jgi:Ca-activated chloride channel family protein
MPFTTPLALLGLLFVPAVIAMYLLKLRRDEAPVPSTLLWTKLVADVEANAPWQRLRRSLLLLLQLLLVLLLVLLAARPFLERPAGLAGDIVLVIDTSASMSATDVQPNRLAAAKAAAVDALRDLPNGGKVSVIAAGRTARVVATGSSDLGRIRQAIASIEATSTAGDLGDALRLASALAARSGDAEIVVATDAALARVPTTRAEAPIRVIQVGTEPKNQAIAALSIRTAPSGLTKSAFISVANLDLATVKRRIEVYGDGNLLEARDVNLDPQARADIVVDDITQQNTRHIDVVEVRLVPDEDGAAGDDRLALDDRAWAIVPSDQLRQVLIVGEGDPYLETALSYLPNTELYGRTPDEYPTTTGLDQFELIIFEGYLPLTLPPNPILAIAPPRSGPLGELAGTLKEPGIGALSADEPLLRYVDLSTTHISQAQKLILPEWARPIISGPTGSPLLYAGERAGVKTAVLAFEPRKSDLPLQVAFPILMANLTGELMGGSGAPTEVVSPGRPVNLPIPTGASGIRVARPDGTTVDLAPGTVGATSVTFSETDQLGVYTVTPTGIQASPGPSSSASPVATSSLTSPTSPSPGPSAGSSEGSSAGGSLTPSRPPTDPSAPFRFAVDLFDVDESRIAPGDASRITRLGGAVAAASPGASASAGASASSGAAASPAPSPSAATGSGAAAPERPPARDELWVPVLLAVLLFLLIEWAVYQRDALIRAFRGVRSRVAARTGRTTGGG